MRNEPFRVFAVTFLLAAAICVLAGCTMPQSVQFAPLATVNVQDSANGNTVTPVAP